MKIALSFILLCYAQSLFALSSFYDNQTRQELSQGNLQNQSLVSFIARVSNQKFRALGYNKNMKKVLFGEIYLEDDHEGYYIEDTYCEFIVRDGKESRIGPGIIPKNEVMNVEHTWPQSLGAKREPARSDMHHLFPTDSRANSTRGNHPFAEVEGKDARPDCDIAQAGKAIDPETGKVTNIHSFEPPLKHRGNVARAMFYMSSKYKYDIPRIEEAYLRKWHREDPVDAQELRRNDLIQEAQGNRNPYIDFPELVDRIDNF